MFQELGNILYQKIFDAKNELGVKQVYNYMPSQPFDSFPAATILPRDTSVDYLDSCNRILDLPFAITLLVQNTKDILNMENNLRGVVDNVVMFLKKDFQENNPSYMDGNAQSLKIEIKRGYNNDQQSLRICELLCHFTLTI